MFDDRTDAGERLADELEDVPGGQFYREFGQVTDEEAIEYLDG
ncbi:hypothetical protein RBH26_12375 [Natronolimnohabitans sp. A-GB9]|nr:hypothetical protein [Natronolimnohabitans sp. A-GB9]MDQ2051275.1 hypothetical protein [Natronolimnohabitans sp. A-GB9]